MRIDDRLETTLRQVGDDGIGLSAKWQQLVDILSQNPSDFDPAAVASGLQKARQFMDMVPATVREQCVRALSGRLRSAPLLLLLSGDVPAVAAAAVSAARLSDHEWADIVPPYVHRCARVLAQPQGHWPYDPACASVMLFGGFRAGPRQSGGRDGGARTASFANPHIVDRIEKLRVEREQHDPAEIPAEVSIEQVVLFAEPIEEIRFETDEHGTISWIDGAPAGAVVGVNIAEPAFDAGPGPDAYGAAAFRQKMPLENARMRLCGAPAIARDWRINAAPFFEPASGRFNGYRGILRRPNLAEVAHIPEGDTHDAENIQQLIHELRTPLSAIIGFSEIIEQQLFGPVTEEYRTIAGNILHDAQRLLSGFDDLSTAAKIETETYVTEAGSTDCDWLSLRLAERLRELSDVLHVTLNLVHAHPVRPFALDNHLAERLFSRLLSAVIIGCEAGEILDGRFRTEPGLNAVNRFVLSLPKRLVDMDESELFGSGPGSFDDSHGAPLLGLGFSLRLVRSLARNVGGDLRFYNQALIVSLPAVSDGRAGLMDEER